MAASNVLPQPVGMPNRAPVVRRALRVATHPRFALLELRGAFLRIIVQRVNIVRRALMVPTLPRFALAALQELRGAFFRCVTHAPSVCNALRIALFALLGLRGAFLRIVPAIRTRPPVPASGQSAPVQHRTCKNYEATVLLAPASGLFVQTEHI
eukprot:1229545-Pyramimonas_sp.AAC.1